MRILFFGDDITHGIGDPSGSWVRQLGEHYDTLPDTTHDLYELGISGEVARGVVERLALETESRRGFGEDVVLVIAVGINDSQYHNNEPVSDPELYKGELQQILAIAHQYTERVMFVGLTPVDDELCDPAKNEFGYRNARVREFDAELRNFCESKRIPIAKVYDALQNQEGNERLFIDGLHPNKKGHQIIAECVRLGLDPLLK